MVTTFSCPVCRTALMFAAPLGRIACPFCGVTLQIEGDGVPAGTKLRCRRCQGVFTAGAPAPLLEPLPAGAGACPLCGVLLMLPAHVPPCKTIRCPQCRGKFPPSAPAALALPSAAGRIVAAPAAAPSELSATVSERPREAPCPAQAALRAPAKSAPKTQLVANKPSSRSKTQLAPPNEVPSSSGDALVTEPDDEDVLAVPPPIAAPKPAAQPPHRKGAPDDDADGVEHPAEEPNTDPAPGPPARKAVPRPRPPAREESLANATAPETLPVPRRSVSGRPVSRQKAAKKPPEPERKPARAPASQLAGAALAECPETTAAEPISAAPAKTEAPKPYRPPPSIAPTAARHVSSEPGAGLLWAKRLLIAAAIVGVLYAGYHYFPTGLLGTRRTVYPTEGSVFYNGKPAVGALVTLFPVEKSDRYFPTGKVGDDGTFKLTTYEPDDGAPAGKYRVTISRGQMDAAEYGELSKKMSPQDIAQLMKKRARDPLYEKYNNPRESGLTAEVSSQPLNKLERFDLR